MNMNMHEYTNGFIGLFYCVFDDIEGPKLLNQYPEKYISLFIDFTLSRCFDVSLFHDISEFIITKDILVKRTLQVSINGYEVLGHPIQIMSPRYPRNRFLFNFCFLFSNCQYVELYKPLVEKSAMILQELEESSLYLSSEKTKNEFGLLLNDIYDGIKEKGECKILLNHYIPLSLFLSPPPFPIVDIDFSQVPVFICSKDSFRKSFPSPYIFDSLLVKINGITPVFDMIDSIHTKDRLSILLSFLLQIKVIQMVDYFHISNIYIYTHKAPQKIKDIEFINQCKEYSMIETHNDPNVIIPTVSDIYKLLSLFNYSRTISEICQDETFILLRNSLDIRRFVLFLVLHEVLRRVYRYPIVLNEEEQQVKTQELSKELSFRKERIFSADELNTNKYIEKSLTSFKVGSNTSLDSQNIFDKTIYHTNISYYTNTSNSQSNSLPPLATIFDSNQKNNDNLSKQSSQINNNFKQTQFSPYFKNYCSIDYICMDTHISYDIFISWCEQQPWCELFKK
ncbi:hypothetical protein WA158_003626 [Blastocystis sp. Blastoise]